MAKLLWQQTEERGRRKCAVQRRQFDILVGEGRVGEPEADRSDSWGVRNGLKRWLGVRGKRKRKA